LFMDIKKEMGYKHLITQVQELWRMVSKNWIIQALYKERNLILCWIVKKPQTLEINSKLRRI
jgi:hypothetical protein